MCERGEEERKVDDRKGRRGKMRRREGGREEGEREWKNPQLPSTDLTLSLPPTTHPHTVTAAHVILRRPSHVTHHPTHPHLHHSHHPHYPHHQPTNYNPVITWYELNVDDYVLSRLNMPLNIAPEILRNYTSSS